MSGDYGLPDTLEELGDAGSNLITAGGVPASKAGCASMIAVLVLLAAGAVIVVSRLFGGSSTPPSDGTAPADVAAADPQIEQTVDPAIGSFVDPANPNAVVPVAGGWAIDNGLFVPNCGSDDVEPGTGFDTGTIDVWAKGNVLELSGSDVSLVLERLEVSDTAATYEGAFGFVEITLVFADPTSFDATIGYSGDEECVSRSASGSLVEGSDARQHGALAFPSALDAPITGPQRASDDTYAVLTVDGTDYEFGADGPVATCDPDLFGRFFVVLHADGFASSLTIELVPDGTEPSLVEANLAGPDLDLVADETAEWAAVEPGSSRVVEFTIDGTTATGSASFINEDRAYNPANHPLPVIDGSFEVTCGS